ncbi:MAG: hypothetical protein AAFQ82_12670 [Myxococcota bacterium]
MKNTPIDGAVAPTVVSSNTQPLAQAPSAESAGPQQQRGTSSFDIFTLGGLGFPFSFGAISGGGRPAAQRAHATGNAVYEPSFSRGKVVYDIGQPRYFASQSWPLVTSKFWPSGATTIEEARALNGKWVDAEFQKLSAHYSGDELKELRGLLKGSKDRESSLHTIRKLNKAEHPNSQRLVDYIEGLGHWKRANQEVFGAFRSQYNTGHAPLIQSGLRSAIRNLDYVGADRAVLFDLAETYGVRRSHVEQALAQYDQA